LVTISARPAPGRAGGFVFDVVSPRLVAYKTVAFMHQRRFFVAMREQYSRFNQDERHGDPGDSCRVFYRFS
jgi:hypothetical protein